MQVVRCKRGRRVSGWWGEIEDKGTVRDRMPKPGSAKP